MESFDYEICWKCNEIYEDVNMKPYCEKCVTPKKMIMA
jgi:hypothetical protein